ncbi:glycosyltransferase [Marivita hallyeonensis]|uniref:Glycosyltransferase involved in cell wall bisynthesis n=1 Tax=Marivita hallyeonensis TaxID=996342 RepID=A0A1M5Y438_9RHOB|nr:glycosyltransferase [Marivita hallyeonensis]SHI06831.1 Glycosyltransferase involved in cell wall bisynthesis [Marivita hallyeonensis]
MRIGVLRTQVPFVHGGAERHAANLVAALNQYGHEATEITLPFKWYPGEVLADHILAARMHDLSEFEGVPVDMAIGLKFPAWLAHHPNKLYWILHQHRAAYDLWSTGDADLMHDPDGDALRALIHAEDRAAFTASPHPIYANSGNVAGRLKTYLDLDATPLYHPPPNAERLWQGDYGDYLFAPGRINPSKRLELILRGLAATRSKIPLVIAGVAENPGYQQDLHALALELGIANRITWLGRVDDETLLRHYAEARAVVFVPQDEDYGYITLEAMLSGRPVITCTDSGGPLEFITDGIEGRVTAPKPADLGQAFEEVMSDPTGAERMGQAGLARYTDMQITWEHVVDTLVGRSDQQVHPLPVEEGTSAPEDTATAPAEAPPELSPQEQAVQTLTAAIAPPSAPEDLPFANIEEVLAAYAFDELPGLLGDHAPPIDTGLANYLGTHWTRYMTTLRALDGIPVTSALDVGVFPPLVFQALLANQFPGIRMAGLWEGPDPYVQTVRSVQEGAFPGFDIRLEAVNSERDPWPYPDDSFELVTGMEILEHLALDPYFFFSEANRVLKPGGHILLTTPNIVSHRGVSKMLNGIAPYSFGIFVPSGGVYGRHNREHGPKDLPDLGQAAGFETVLIRTVDVYDRTIDPKIAEMLVERGDDLTLRGETIFYLAQKASAPKGLPKRFYHGDPTRMTGTLSVASVESATGLTRITVQNGSNQWWSVGGDHATCILAEWIDGAGDLRHQHLMQPITAPIAPHSAGEIALRLDPEGIQDQGTLRLHLYQSGVGTMTGSGRAPTLTLPCSQDAFLRVVKSTPLPGDVT